MVENALSFWNSSQANSLQRLKFSKAAKPFLFKGFYETLPLIILNQSGFSEGLPC
jgi:hypothetical protein